MSPTSTLHELAGMLPPTQREAFAVFLEAELARRAGGDFDRTVRSILSIPRDLLCAGREGVFVIDPQRTSPLLRMVESLGVKRPAVGSAAPIGSYTPGAQNRGCGHSGDSGMNQTLPPAGFVPLELADPRSAGLFGRTRTALLRLSRKRPSLRRWMGKRVSLGRGALAAG